MISFSLYMVGCSVSSDDGPPVDPEFDRTTPENLIKYFADAYEKEDIDKYEESLHDQFLFEFLPDDADSAGLPPDTPWWGKVSEVTAAGKLFDAATITKIEMDLPIDVGPWDTEDGLGFRLDPLIKVTEEKPDYTEPKVYQVEDSYLYVETVRDPYDEDLWVFKEITETKKEGFLASAGK
jgi:hypothetical protein